jgi:hypothetical protein
MRAERINQWLALGANVGVLIGIVLLVVELSQNDDMMRAQTRNELARGLTEVLSLTVADAGLTDAVLRANSGAALTAIDAHRINSRSELIFRYWENMHYQYRQELYDESEYSRHRDTVAVVLAENRSLVQYWCLERELFSVPFAELIETLVPAGVCPPPQ